MNEYSSPNNDLILKKTNMLLKQKITNVPEYKAEFNMKYPNIVKTQLKQSPVIITNDSYTNYETIKNISNNNIIYNKL
jgi:hypothetical protein